MTTNREFVIAGAVGIAGLLSGYAIGARTGDDDAEVMRAERHEAHRGSTPHTHDRERVAEPEPQAVAQVPTDSVEPDCARQRTAAVTTDMFMLVLRDEIRAQERLGDDLPLEYRANNFQAFISGWMSGIHAVNPTAGAGIADAIVDRLCSDDESDLERLAMLRILHNGTIASARVPRGLECALSDRFADGELSEDVVTWAALDAWAALGRRPSETIEQIRRLATDRRTVSRLDGSREQRQRGYNPEGL